MFLGSFVRLAVLLFCASLFLSNQAFAAASTRVLTKSGAPVLISASSMFGDSEKQTVELVGDVQMSFEGQNLRADRAIMDKKNGKIFAQGNLILASPAAYVEGTSAEISYDDNTGLIYDGFVKSGQVLFQGRIIRKTGPDEYEVEDANYTACTTCPPAWSFSGSHIDAELGAYAYIKSAWFYAGGLRFFWFPYLIVPLKSERQTGFLFPAFEYINDGFAIGVPFFWAISRSQDMTFTPKYYTRNGFENRGFKGILNYRYVLTEESRGETTFGGFLKDKTFSLDANLPNRPGDERSGRWFLNHDHIYVLPGGFINRAKLNLISDLRYTRDFPEDIKGLGDPALENRLSLTKNTELMHSSIEVGYYVNQLKQDPLDGNSDSVHRFPELRQSGIDRSLFDSRVFFKWDFNYVNFARESIAFDDVVLTGDAAKPKSIDRTFGSGGTGSGSFQPGVDTIRAGQRLDLRPEISAPFRIGKYFDILPSVQFRHTQYSFNVTAPPGGYFNAIPTRQYARGSFAIRTQMSRIYEDNDNEEPTTADGRPLDASQGRLPATEGESQDESGTGIFQALQTPKPRPKPERLKHEIEPEISISGIPWLHQSDSPFFSSNAATPMYMTGQPVSDSDFYSANGLQFDYNDRITQRNIVSTLITNRFIKKTWSGDTPVYRQIISIKNGTSYEFDKFDRNAAANFSDIFTIIDARFQNFDTDTSIRYFPLHRVFNTSSRIRVLDDRSNYLQVSFSQNHLITENIAQAYPLRDENVGFALGYNHRYAQLVAQLNYLPATYSPIDLRLKSWSAKLNLTPPGDCWSINALIEHTIGEPRPRVAFGFETKFGGTL